MRFLAAALLLPVAYQMEQNDCCFTPNGRFYIKSEITLEKLALDNYNPQELTEANPE